MHIDFNKMLIIQKTHAVLMLSMSSYICINICLLFKIDFFFMNFKIICISNHNIMLLATSLLRIFPNYVLYGMYEIGDCIYVIVLALFYHTYIYNIYIYNTTHYMLILFNMGISYTDIFVF